MCQSSSTSGQLPIECAQHDHLSAPCLCTASPIVHPTVVCGTPVCRPARVLFTRSAAIAWQGLLAVGKRSSLGDHCVGIKARATPCGEPDALVVSRPRQMSELQASSAAAQRAIREYHRTVKQDVLRSVQLAKGMREAYPCLLNTLAICAVLGAQLPI